MPKRTIKPTRKKMNKEMENQNLFTSRMTNISADDVSINGMAAFSSLSFANLCAYIFEFLSLTLTLCLTVSFHLKHKLAFCFAFMFCFSIISRVYSLFSLFSTITKIYLSFFSLFVCSCNFYGLTTFHTVNSHVYV